MLQADVATNIALHLDKGLQEGRNHAKVDNFNFLGTLDGLFDQGDDLLSNARPVHDCVHLSLLFGRHGVYVVEFLSRCVQQHHVEAERRCGWRGKRVVLQRRFCLTILVADSIKRSLLLHSQVNESSERALGLEDFSEVVRKEQEHLKEFQGVFSHFTEQVLFGPCVNRVSGDCGAWQLQQ